MVAIPGTGSGNAILPNPLEWHQVLIAAFIVGISIWLVEQQVSSNYAMIAALLILLSILVAHPDIAKEIQAIYEGR